MRELILTANKDWFAEFEITDDRIDFTARQRSFEAVATKWLQDNFGNDVVHARADHDEAAYHIHAVIMPRHTVVSKTGRRKRMLQPSIHPLIADYEKAQDSVGEAFSVLGLTRGERRAEAIRAAAHEGNAPPAPRRHVRTRE
jgi:hypothetical protein